jgi:hypothetical protein
MCTGNYATNKQSRAQSFRIGDYIIFTFSTYTIIEEIKPINTSCTPVRKDRNIFAGKPAGKKSLSISRYFKVILSYVLKIRNFGL